MSNEMRWIPVTERLPEEIGTDCLVAVELADGRYLTVNTYWDKLDDKWCFTEWNDYYDGLDEVRRVVAWMPTPVYIPEEN